MSGIETPVWVKYAGDLFFLILFLVFLFFFKPSPHGQDEWDDESTDPEEDAPNPLEKMLISDGDNDEGATHSVDESELTDPEELSQSDR